MHTLRDAHRTSTRVIELDTKQSSELSISVCTLTPWFFVLFCGKNEFVVKHHVCLDSFAGTLHLSRRLGK